MQHLHRNHDEHSLREPDGPSTVVGTLCNNHFHHPSSNRSIFSFLARAAASHSRPPPLHKQSLAAKRKAALDASRASFPGGCDKNQEVRFTLSASARLRRSCFQSARRVARTSTERPATLLCDARAGRCELGISSTTARGLPPRQSSGMYPTHPGMMWAIVFSSVERGNACQMAIGHEVRVPPTLMITENI